MTQRNACSSSAALAESVPLLKQRAETRARLAHTAARLVDARRRRRNRAVDGRCARSRTRRATSACRRCVCPSDGSTQKDHRFRQALLKRLERQGLGRAPAARRDARRDCPATAAAKVDALATLLERHGDDPITVDAALSGLGGSEHVVLRRLLQTAAQAPQRSAVVTMLAATIVRGAQDEPFQEVLQLARAERSRRVAARGAARRRGSGAAQRTAAGQRTARRGGGGGAARRRRASSAPGARGGPGGAPAFPRHANADAAAGGRGRGNALAPVPVDARARGTHGAGRGRR